jgi:hypothetical protein
VRISKKKFYQCSQNFIYSHQLILSWGKNVLTSNLNLTPVLKKYHRINYWMGKMILKVWKIQLNNCKTRYKILTTNIQPKCFNSLIELLNMVLYLGMVLKINLLHQQILKGLWISRKEIRLARWSAGWLLINRGE